MDILEHTKALRLERANLIEQAKAPFDDAAEAKRTLTPEERQKVDALDARIDEITGQVKDLDERNTREHDAAVAREAFERQYGATGAERKARNEVDEFRSWASGQERRSEDFEGPGKNAWAVNLRAVEKEAELIRMGVSGEELRALLWDTGSVASGVPTLLARTVYQYMTAGIAAERMPTYKFTTDGGGPLVFPKTATHSIATQVIAQGTAIGGTDPVLGKFQLDAYKYGELLQVSNETLSDVSFDILGYIGMEIGRAVAQRIDLALVAGSGSGEPQGMTTAATVGNAGTASTGGTLPAGSGTTPIPYEALVDTVYGINDQYRQMNCAWLMRDSTAAQLRKLRDGTGGTVGAVLWRPSLTEGIQGGQPGLLLDYPVFVDPNVASLASNAKVAFFGNWNAFFRRNIGDFVIERSDEYAFNVDEVTFRGKQRVDSEFADLTAVITLKNSV